MSSGKQAAQRRLDELDARLGKGEGAARERRKLEAIIAGGAPKRERRKVPKEPEKSPKQQAKESREAVHRGPNLDKKLGKALRSGDQAKSEARARQQRRKR